MKQTLVYGEAGSIQKYFLRRLHDNHSFQYTIQLNFEEKINNIVWADARMMIDYTLFGDVITFDTAYCKKNIKKKNRSLGVFFGFNHCRET